MFTRLRHSLLGGVCASFLSLTVAACSAELADTSHSDKLVTEASVTTQIVTGGSSVGLAISLGVAVVVAASFVLTFQQSTISQHDEMDLLFSAETKTQVSGLRSSRPRLADKVDEVYRRFVSDREYDYFELIKLHSMIVYALDAVSDPARSITVQRVNEGRARYGLAPVPGAAGNETMQLAQMERLASEEPKTQVIVCEWLTNGGESGGEVSSDNDNFYTEAECSGRATERQQQLIQIARTGENPDDINWSTVECTCETYDSGRHDPL